MYFQLAKHKFLFFGAGEAGIGIAELMSAAIAQQTGCTLEQGRTCCWFVDSKGLINSERKASLETHKLHYAHDISKIPGWDKVNKGVF